MAPGHAFISAALLFIGLLMAVNPTNILRALESVTTSMRAFEQLLQGFDPLPEPNPDYNSALARAVVRCLGLLLSTCAFLYLSGLVG